MEKQYNKGYTAPNGNWYKNPQEEIRSHQEGIEASQNVKDAYNAVTRVCAPGVLYLALRCAGRFAGIGPEIDEASLNSVPADALGFSMTYFYLAGKASELLVNLDLRSAKKGLLEAKARLGLGS